MSDTKYPPLTIRLFSLNETAWVLEGTERDRNPVKLNFPGKYRILPTSKVRVPLEEGGYRLQDIRHIAGCDFLDPVRQDKEGYKVNLEADNIYLENGTLTVNREGSTIGTYDYLKQYQGNGNFENRPPEAEVEFLEVIASEIAKKDNQSFDRKAEAYAVLRELRVQDGDRFVYDQEKLALLATLFNLNHLDTDDEKMHELYLIVDTRPELLINSVANSKKQLYAMLKNAEEYGVLSFDESRAYLTDSKVTILAYRGKVARNKQAVMLGDFLLTAEGKPFYEQLNNLVQLASTNQLARVN